jgi:peptide/nickel transport system substrate-binding protein
MAELIRGRYRILGRAGSGGEAEVVRALDTQHDRLVALKVRRVGTPGEREALLQEARVLLGLRPHPNLPLVREDFFEGDHYYVVMDWIEGESLDRVLTEHPGGLAMREVIEELRPVAVALDHLHAHVPPVFHRDVKPGNLIRRPDGRVVLVDFGLSSPSNGRAPSPAGTPGFAAPELATGDPPTKAADVYGLAATALALLSGRATGVTLPTLAELPNARAVAVRACLRRGLSIDPARRQPSAASFVDELADAAGLGTPRSPRVTRRWLGAGALVTSVAAVIVLALARSGPPGPTSSNVPVPADAVGVLSVATLHGGPTIALGGRPVAAAYGEGALWIVDAASDSLVRVDPARGTVTARILVGNLPTSVAIAPGSVWVADSGDRAVSRVDPHTNTVLATITVGNAPTAVAADDGSVWVANTLDDTVTRLDAASGAWLATIPVGPGPTGIAVGLGSVWVTDQDGGEVSRISPSGNAVIDTIPVGRHPTFVAVGSDAVWVANQGDGTLSRIDPQTESVTTSDVGADGAIAADGTAIWVADESGDRLVRIEAATRRPSAIVSLGDPPHDLAAAAGSLYVLTRSPLTAHRGGTLRVVSAADPLDPEDLIQQAALALTSDTLIAYRRVGGAAGSELVPDLAASIPAPTDAGLTYTFRLRAGIHYSDGRLLQAADVRWSFERAMGTVHGFGRIFPEGIGPPLIGADRCSPNGCDLSAAIVADPAAGTVTFHLARPDPDFYYRIAHPAFSIVPASAPTGAASPGAAASPTPVTGPYIISSFDAARQVLVLRRNPDFVVWSEDARPDGFPDEIDLQGGVDPGTGEAMVEQGQADVLLAPSLPDVGQAAAQFPGQVHVYTTLATSYAFLNTTVPPFNDVRVRRALNDALDRGTISQATPSYAGRLTCQVLPPDIAGYRPYCPYSLDPESGVWSAPDLATARALVAASGTRGMDVTLWTTPEYDAPAAAFVGTLSELGYHATLRSVAGYGDYIRITGDPRTRAQIGMWRWGADIPAADDFFDVLLSCDAIAQGLDPAQFCDANIDAAIHRAQDLQAQDPAAADTAWAAVDRAVVDAAPWVPYINQIGVDLVSARVGDYEHQPASGILLDQLWLR